MGGRNQKVKIDFPFSRIILRKKKADFYAVRISDASRPQCSSVPMTYVIELPTVGVPLGTLKRLLLAVDAVL